MSGLRFQQRRFAWGSNEWLCCEVAQLPVDDELWLVFRDSTEASARGVLTSAFEYIANIFRIELMLKQHWGCVRHFHVNPLLSDRAGPPRIREVKMSVREGQYHYATWVPLDDAATQVFTAVATLQAM